MRKILSVIISIFIIENAVWLMPRVLSLVLRKEKSQIVRGWEKAENLGCFSCHGPRGFGDTPNPKSEEDTIPSFRGGEPAMYAKNDKQLRETILYGHRLHDKKKEKKKPEKDSGLKTDESKIPVFGNVNITDDEEKKEEGLIKMPTWKKWVSPQDVEDLIVFIKANAVMMNPKEKDLKEGRELVLNNGCFACHGPLGAGGIKNPGSFKGYIPSFIGKDFDELVKNKEELLEWLKEGKIQRFERNPLARFFTRRQPIKMPAYKNVLKKNEIEKIIAYLNWLREEGKKYR